MGRTAPSSRVLVESELERLLRVSRHLRDPGDRGLLEDLLRSVHRVLDAYRYEAMGDPLEPILVAMILEVARRCRERGGNE
ncbi:MAG: hypothetical protein F7C82_02605 [Desulfurococcales archaeon]|nr:hypothetical protein [Desulfurococcales archaeon]MCE4627350.1 hypothetical protein [Desulfurococcales archaeon]MCE4629149.1 hypothetical protein [Desulfurococcales archaeon]